MADTEVGLIQKATLQDIADAIREKTETEDKVTPAQMADRIRAIEASDDKVDTLTDFRDGYF